MSVNFNLLDPNMPANIAGSVYAGQQQQQQNQLAKQQAQMRQQEMGMRQQEIGMRQQGMAEQATERQRLLANQERRTTFLRDLGQKLAEGGKVLDRPTLGEMISSGIPEVEKLGFEGIKSLDEQQQFEEQMGRIAPKAEVAPAGLDATAPSNALAPAAAPTNALTAGYSRPQIEQMLISSNPKIRDMGKNLLSALPKPVAEPSDISTMSRLGYPLTQAGYQAFRDAQRQERLLTPEELKQKLQVAAAMRSVTTVQLPPQEKAEQAERGKMLTSEYSDISKAAKLAAKTLPSIDANLTVLDSGFKTGFGTETVAAGAKVLAALGVDNAEKFAENAQIFQAKAAEAVLQKQLEQKGPQTQSDRELIEKTGAQLGTTTQGNKFLLTVAKEQLKREMEQRNFYDNWWKNNKTYDGAESAWYSSEGGKSLFDRPALKAYAAPNSASQIPTTAAPARAPVAPATTAITNPKFPGFSIGKP